MWIDPLKSSENLTASSFLVFALVLQRNYPFFICFITSSTILCIYVFVFSWINLLRQGGSLWNAMSHDVLSMVLIFYCFIAVWFVGGLTVFHFYLICTNQVTLWFPRISIQSDNHVCNILRIMGIVYAISSFLCSCRMRPFK